MRKMVNKNINIHHMNLKIHKNLQIGKKVWIGKEISKQQQNIFIGKPYCTDPLHNLCTYKLYKLAN